VDTGIQPSYPPTATPVERIALALSGVVIVVALLAAWYWLAAIGFVGASATAGFQQVREIGARRAGLAELEQALPSMTKEQRVVALEAFRRRFPSRITARKLKRFTERLESRRQSSRTG
jgi:hypothetical protein